MRHPAAHNFNQAVWSWMRHDRNQRYADGYVDNAIVFDEMPLGQEFQDHYEAQPWSA